MFLLFHVSCRVWAGVEDWALPKDKEIGQMSVGLPLLPYTDANCYLYPDGHWNVTGE
jgi:hypothetical protein